MDFMLGCGLLIFMHVLWEWELRGSGELVRQEAVVKLLYACIYNFKSFVLARTLSVQCPD